MSKDLSAKYYQDNNERLQKILRKMSRSFQRRKTKHQYGHEHYKNLLEDEKQKAVERREKYYRMRKNAL